MVLWQNYLASVLQRYGSVTERDDWFRDCLRPAYHLYIFACAEELLSTAVALGINFNGGGSTGFSVLPPVLAYTIRLNLVYNFL
jgi:hypothetical protein